MSFCVNIHSKEFQDLSERLDISAAALENILHEFINTEGEGAFPSDSAIRERFEPAPINEATKKSYDLWRERYSEPIRVRTLAAANAVMEEAARYFPKESITLKETKDESYEIRVGKFTAEALSKVVSTPIKDAYRGKLIYAQSGTGKSRIADNVNVIDSDTLLAEVLGTSAEAASFVFNNLDTKQKLAISDQYHQRIREELAKGHTVLTASSAMMEEADVVVYNESTELTNLRTSAEDRGGSNRYTSKEKAEQDILKASAVQNKEVIKLDAEHFLSDYLLTDPSFKVDRAKKADSLSEAVTSFLQDFNLTVNSLEGYRGDLPLFDAVNRVINARKASDVTNAMGYAVAFMMQQEPSLRKLFIRESLNQLFPGMQRLFPEDFVERVMLNDKEKSIKLPIGVAKLVGRKYVTPSEIFAHLPGKEKALKTIGNDIAKTLREYYEGKPTTNFVQEIWQAIKDFFNKVTHKGYYQERLDYINQAAEAIIRKDPSFMKGPEYKIGSTTRASLMDLAGAFKDNPFEKSIIKTLSDLNIALAGSASIRAAGTIFRPAENPLHDIDFEASGFRSKEQLTKTLEGAFPHIQHFRSIKSRDVANEYTESYVLLDRDFHLEKGEEGFLSIIDEATNEVIGKVDLKKNEIVEATDPNMKSKLLDFFINTKQDGGFGTYNLTINGEEYLLSDARNAWDAKVRWQRRKDLWDWARFSPNENFTREGTANQAQEMSEIEKQMAAIKSAAIANGTFMKAPNGNQSNLTERQWLQVRTKEFKNWFGDWENDPRNASKIIDENGEPLVVYHGSSARFSEFSYEHVLGSESGFFFSSDRSYAKQFGTEEYPVFLNIRNFLPANDIPLHRDTIYSIFATSEESADYLNKVDGIIGNDMADGKLVHSKGTEFMVYRSNQIKSAVANSGEFSPTNNNIYFNIEGKSLKEFLRDKGLIHAYNPTLGETDEKAFYVTKGDGTYSIKSIVNEIYNTLRRNGISPEVVSFQRTKSGKALRIDFAETQDQIARSNDKDIQQIKKVVDFLQARIPALKGNVKYATVEEANKALGRKLKAHENSFVKDGKVYLVGRRFTTDIAIEECLHPFTATLRFENPFLYNRLAYEAMETFPKLWADIVSNYTVKEGFTEDDRIAELVTQSLSRAFREEYNSTTESTRKTFSDYVKQFISWFKNLFYRVNPVTGNQIIDLETIKPDMTIRELAGLINTSDTEFAVSYEEKTRFNKERAKINPEDKDFITETIVLPGMSSSTLKEINTIWDRVTSRGSEIIKVPYGAWKELGVSLAVYQDGLVGRDIQGNYISRDSIKSLEEEVMENWYDGDKKSFYQEYRYDRASSSMIMPRSIYDIAQLVKLLQPVEKDVIRALADFGYNTSSNLFDLVEAISILATGEQVSFEDLLTRIGGEFYYSDSRQGELFTEEGPSQGKEQVVRPELGAFQERTSRFVAQLNTLLDSDLMSNTEVRHIAEQVVYYISDEITEFLKDPEKALRAFETALAVKENGEPMTAEERAARAEELKKLSRVELVKLITPQRLLEYTRAHLFTRKGNPENLTSLDRLNKAKLIYDNFDAIVRFASDVFSLVEDFSIVSNKEGLEVETNLNPISDDLNSTNDADAVLENEGSLQEHWQIESRTLDVLTSMSQLIKQALNRCFQVTVDPATGEEKHVISEFGVAERLNPKDATASILRWTQGAESLSHMVELLEAKAGENPWIKQIISRLKDTSGNETDFQSQFYGVFAKAFQSYTVVTREMQEDGSFIYKSIPVNQHPALREATSTIEVAYKTNTHPLFDNGKIRKDVLETLTAISNDLFEKGKVALEQNDRAEIVNLINKAAAVLGYVTDESTVNLALDSNATFVKIVNAVKKIADTLSKSADKEVYDPFKYTNEGIGGYLKEFLTPLTSRLEDTAVSAFYDSGKMYQSHVTPSYLTVLMNHFTGSDERFQEFLEQEYGQYEWFKNPDGTWKLLILEKLDGKSQEDRKKAFGHKVQLNFNKHNYMRNMTDTEYGLSILAEYAADMGNAKGTEIPAWFRVPMMSNKPSSEFIKMTAYVGARMELQLTSGFSKIFQQELSRIQTTSIRDYNKKHPNFIKNFDKNGKRFMMLDSFNRFLEGGKEANSELGKLIQKAINEGTEYDANTKKGLTSEENARLNTLVEEEIKRFMNAKADSVIAQWKSNGIFEGAKQIANFGKDDATIETKLREFVWNDTYAAMSILELTITDPAYYKDAEDLQKRLAQIHAPGIRANVEATDYQGNRVTDGKFRTLLLTDFDDFVSNIKDNLRIVFDKKLRELETSGVTTDSARYKAEAATYESIIAQFDNINVADAQGYSSPTSYRKKAFIFGKWSKSAEDIYQKLKSGDYRYTDLKTAFQPLKPFVYGQIERPSINPERSTLARPLSKLKVPVQFKNSEYLLIMADAILQNEDTGRPNLLRAVYQVMEESAERNPTRGIDTIQFESTCKSGLQGRVDIKQFSNVKGGETLAKRELESAIYNEDGSYNTATYVYEVPFENYAIQQEVPEHFKNHEQAHGSQIRYIIPSDLETVDSAGNPVTYDFFDRGQFKQLTAEQFKAEYEANIEANINDSLEELSEKLGLGDKFLSQKDRNIALSNILLEEIMSSPRYGVELAVACTVDSNTGEFNIPLGDPIQSKRIEQLINSVIKNRVNKQEIAGGPVVQVTNFGTSRELNIRFNGKDGNLLMTKEEFAKTAPRNGKAYDIDAAYKKYIEDNQAGIAYYEVFAPIYANELFEKFADKDGNIDIETIEAINPDLLKMIGYRIPTEDKYSMAPLKIVGFLPREAGDGIMLPNDITLLTGSDFDVDKFYLMRKDLSVMMRQFGPESTNIENFNQATKEYTKNHRQNLVNHLRNFLQSQSSTAELSRYILLTEEEEQEATRNGNRRVEYRIDAENRRHEKALEDIRRGREVAAAPESVESRTEENKYSERQEEKVSEQLSRAEERENKRHQRKLAELEAEREDSSKRAKERATTEKLNNLIYEFLDGEIMAKQSNPLDAALKREYIKYVFDYIEPTEGTTYRNNKIVDMSWAVLTNETTASKMLTPGGFEPEKSMGYMVSAYQNPVNSFTWEELQSLANGTKGLLDGKLVDLDPNNKDIETGTDALKTLCYTEKNLCFIDTHLQFYKQNSAASTALGMAAVQKVAHAVLESNGYRISIDGVLDFDEGESFTIAGKEFSGYMEIDAKYNDEGKLIGRTLGEFVAMFADAVKDPVANLMNINNTTMPIMTTLIRLGMPFEKAALFISQPIIRRALSTYNSENVTNFVRLSDIIERELKAIENKYNLTDASRINELTELTEEELIKGLKFGAKEDYTENVKVEETNNEALTDEQQRLVQKLNESSLENAVNEFASTDYKVLKFFQYVDKISKALKAPTFVTRFNSITSAVGPLIIDNLITEYKMQEGDFKNFFDADGNHADANSILSAHPILRGFQQTFTMAQEIFNSMPANSENFRNLLFSADSDLKRVLFSDRKTLNELSDFYQSYLLVASGAVPTEATTENKHQGLKYYLEQFPADFMRGKAKEIFKGNALIDAIRVDVQKGRTILKIDTTGLTTQEKERLSDGWADLYRDGERGKRLAEHLFYYNFFRTGIGFSPKSFMALFPARLKDKISGYNETFSVHSRDFAKNVAANMVLDQFARNNADNNKLVPKVKIGGKDGLKVEISGGDYVFKGESYDAVADKYYIKTKVAGKDVLLKRKEKTKNTTLKTVTFNALSLLGNNGEYFEVSTNEAYTPLANTPTVVEQRKEGPMTEVSPNQAQIDDAPAEVTHNEDKQKRRVADLLLRVFMTNGRTKEVAESKIAQYREKSKSEQKKFERAMKDFIEKKLKELGINYNQELVEEVYEELC